MSCHGCARSFGFLTKEYGCQKCGFSYCSKCLVNKLCKSCSTKATVTSKSVSSQPPIYLQKALEELEVPKKSPITVYTAPDQRLTSLKRGLSSEDQQLVDRLAKLKSDVRQIKSIPSQDEIEERLAKLKGLDPKIYKQPAFNPVSVPKTNFDSATDLINQIREEVAIDNQSDVPEESINPPTKYEEDDLEVLLRKEAAIAAAEAQLALDSLKKDQEIQDRLEKLRLGRELKDKVQESSSGDGEEVLDSEDEDKQVRSIINRAVAEATLPGKLNDNVEMANEEELPWCVLCNEDAQLRCVDCDADLYCRRCWKETHREPDLKRHHIKEYRT